MSSISLQLHHPTHSHGIGRATKRLHNEYKKFLESPPQNIKVAFKEDQILEWHFLFTGLIGTPFKGGEYHGMLIFTEDYPFSPPSIRFITPNGRFKTDERVCFELSDFHPKCWKPAYTVSAVLQGVYSFMMSETTDTVGSLNMNETQIRSLVRNSKNFNRKDKICNELFHNQFTSNPGHTDSSTTTLTSESLPNYSDQQSDFSKSSSYNLRSQKCTSGTVANSELRSANIKQMPSECTTFNTLDTSRQENPESSEFGEIPTNNSKLNNSEVSLQSLYQSVSQRHEPSLFSNKVNSSLSMKRTKKLSREFQEIIDNPNDNILVSYSEDLISEWHFLFTGLNGTPFEGGEYHGMLMFSEDYPFSPPSIRFITPNGRFQINKRVELSHFYPVCWKPSYTVSSFLQGVYSFMMTETTDTVGSLERNESEIKKLAGKSREFNFQDGSAELFHNEIKVALIENSDTDPIHSQINKPDISSQESQSCSSPDMLKPDVSSKAVETSETTDTVRSLDVDENEINNPAGMSNPFYPNDSPAALFKTEIKDDLTPSISKKIKKTHISSLQKIKSSSLPEALKLTVSSSESIKTGELASTSSASSPDKKAQVSKLGHTRKHDENISSRSQINEINSKTPRLNLQKETRASRDNQNLDKYKCTSIYHNSKVQSGSLFRKEEINAQNSKMLKSIDIPKPKLENKYIVSSFKC